MRSSRKGSRDRCTRRSGGRCSGEDAGKPMSAFRLLAAGLIVAAFASPARAAAPGICAEGAGAMAMHLYSVRSEEDTSELQSLMRISVAVFCLKKKKPHMQTN